MLDNLKKRAAAEFDVLPWPSRKDEYWRFGNLKAWNEAELARASSVRGSHAAFDFLPDDNFITIHGSTVLEKKLPDGVEVFTVAEASVKYPDLFAKFYSQKFGKFDAMAARFAENGMWLNVSKDACVDVFIAAAGGECPFSVFVNIESGRSFELRRRVDVASVSLIKYAYMVGENSVFKNAEILTGREGSRAYSREDFYAGKGAKIFDGFGRRSMSHMRAEKFFRLDSENIEVQSRGFASISDGSVCDIRTHQFHTAKKCASNLEVRASISDGSKLAFTGLIDVAETADDSKAYQSCRSTLLGAGAQADASPILEIKNFDVECSHGCTVSRPDEEVLFYMKQRGLSAIEAEGLLVRGQARTAFEFVSDSDWVENALDSLEIRTI